jgi:type 1 glutamine amidotransferase
LKTGKFTIAAIIAVVLLAVVIGGIYLHFHTQPASSGENNTNLSSSEKNNTNLATNTTQNLKRDHVRVLLYAQGDSNAIYNQSLRIIKALKEDPRIDVVLTSKGSDLAIQNLRANFDAVILYQHNNPGVQTFISREEIADLIKFAGEGHMIVAVHHAIYDPNRNNPDSNYNIIPLTDYFGGYLFDLSTSTGPPAIDGIEDNVLLVVNPNHYLAEGISNFTIVGDEVYFAMVRSSDIVPVVINHKYGPFVWTRGSYAVYMQMGHFADDFDNPMVKRILQNAVLHLPN